MTLALRDPDTRTREDERFTFAVIGAAIAGAFLLFAGLAFFGVFG